MSGLGGGERRDEHPAGDDWARAADGSPKPHRPALRGQVPEALLAFDPYADIAAAMESAEGSARAVVAAARSGEVETDRLLCLGDELGLDALGAVWAHAEAGSLPQSLWVLYVLRDWTHTRPGHVARLAAAGFAHAEVPASIAGVPSLPTGDDLIRLVDDLLRGALDRELSDAFDRAAALCRVLAAGRGAAPSVPASGGDEWADALLGARLLTTAEGLDRAAAAARG